jgi:hypothetical protein
LVAFRHLAAFPIVGISATFCLQVFEIGKNAKVTMTTRAVSADKTGADLIWCLDSGACLLGHPRAIRAAGTEIQDHAALRAKMICQHYQR